MNVQGIAAGTENDTTSAVTSNEDGSGNTASASLTVVAPPSITKVFGASTIPVNGTTTLSFAINNPAVNTVGLGGVAFTDTLPAGLVVATPNGLSASCGESMPTAVAGSTSVSLNPTYLAPGGSCTFSLNVTGTTAGVMNNSVTVSSTNGGTGNTSTAHLLVATPPSLVASFGASSIPLNGSTSLTFLVTNSNSANSISGVGFTDTLPSGLMVATPNSLTGSCGGGTITAAPGTTLISLSSGTLAAIATCTFSVNVIGIAPGTENDTTSAVTSVEAGPGNTGAASITVVAPPSITKAFGAGTIPVNTTTTLSLTLTNPAANPVALSGIAFTDALPAGLVVATPNGLSTTCTGATISATAGSGAVSLTGYSMVTEASCTITLNVTGNTAGAIAFRRVRLSALALAALALMLMAWAACGGGGSATSSVTSNPGTPAGTYALTVTGTFSSSPGQATALVRTQPLSLQVN